MPNQRHCRTRPAPAPRTGSSPKSEGAPKLQYKQSEPVNAVDSKSKIQHFIIP